MAIINLVAFRKSQESALSGTCTFLRNCNGNGQVQGRTADVMNGRQRARPGDDRKMHFSASTHVRVGLRPNLGYAPHGRNCTLGAGRNGELILTADYKWKSERAAAA